MHHMDLNPSPKPLPSEYAGMLNLVAAALQDAGVSFVRLDGAASPAARSEAVRQFSGVHVCTPTCCAHWRLLFGVGKVVNLVDARLLRLID